MPYQLKIMFKLVWNYKMVPNTKIKTKTEQN